MKKTQTTEIISFNETLLDTRNMRELSDEELEQALGGLKECGALTSCTINSDDCPNLESCGWNRMGQEGK